MRRREVDALAGLIDAVVAPEPPLPPVGATDALPSFAGWMDRAPGLNRALVRASLAALEVVPRLAGQATFSGMDRTQRLRVLGRLDRFPLTRPVAEALRSAASISYYGDAGVLRTLGHDPAARVREARERRVRALGETRATTPGGAQAPGGTSATTPGGAQALGETTATTPGGAQALGEPPDRGVSA